MLRFKRSFVWLLMAALIVSMFPGHYTPLAQAATTSYFSPDDLTLQKTVLLDPTVVATSTNTNPAGLITRSSVLLTTNPTLKITGTYSQVTASTMKVTVEQLTQSTSGKWVTDPTRLTTGTVTVDSNSPSNRFTSSGIVLYTGFNKITFSGLQGSLTRSESFYVLYDKIPYLTSLQVLGGPAALNLNEGTQVVVPVDTVTLQGKATNATQVTVALNGGTPLLTTLLDDGTFFTPALTLKPGLSTLKLNIKNASDSIDIERAVYFFDKNQPFAALSIVHKSKSYNLLNNSPTLSDNTTDLASFSGQILVPYDSASFASTAQLTINKGTTGALPLTGLKVTSESMIPGADGVTPAYKLVIFTTNTLPPDMKLIPGTNNFTLSVDYGTYGTSILSSYKYLPGEVVITDMYYLPGYTGTGSISGISKLPLSGQQMEKDNFYILVKTNIDTAATLTANYLPLSNTTVLLTPISGTGLGTASNEYIYQISKFSNGQQKVQFRYGTSLSYFNADIAYVSKNYIYVSSIQDGQTYEFNSINTNTLNIAGEYIGFDNFVSAQVQINGVDSNQLPNNKNFALGITSTKKDFNFSLPITQAGPLVYGENKIVFTGISQDNGANQRIITKELRIYIVDTNVSNLSQLHPALGTGRTAFTKQSLTNEAERNSILALPAEFVYKDGKYTTSQEQYDIVLRGGAATTLNLYKGSELVFSTAGSTDMLTDINDAVGPRAYGPTGQYYEYAGTSADFLLRLRDFKFDAPGSHVYTVELINKTGARTTQRLEVVREVAPFRILSPVPTVGDQIIVNKNFVRFDIEAEGATRVLIDKYEATKRPDIDNRFTYDFVGLKPDKATSIKIQIVRADATLNDTVTVYYASAIQIDTQYMVEKVATKYAVFNKALQLTFPKGTTMKGFAPSGAAKYYPDTKLLFGIADPVDGVVERTNDYGNVINVSPTDSRTLGGKLPLLIPQELVLRFTSTATTNNFSRVSDIYWINGGLGELGVKGSQSYIPATNGIAPYSVEGYFTQYNQARKIVPSQRGQLTLTFSPSIVDEVGSTVTVFRYSDAGKWENIGGAVDTKNHTVTVPFDEFGYYTVMKLRRGYTDITNHPWARNVLNGLFSKGIMNNLRSDAFGADDTTTRGEFATLIVKGLNIPLSYNTSQQTFFDIVPEAVSTTWNFKYIETAARAGIVTGLSDGFFGPDQPLTREQAAVMIARALKLKMATNDAKLMTNLSKSFVDSGSMDFYSRPAILAVSKAKIMEGTPITTSGSKKVLYNFNPKGQLTRAEAGKIAVELLKKSTNIFPKTFN